MIGKVLKWGNSLALRIPANLAKETKIEQGSEVEITIEKGAILLRPLGKEFSLEDLIAGINEENLHSEVDFGRHEGREAL